MMLDYYEETLRELEELEINLNDLSNNELSRAIQTIVSRGWLRVETMFGQKREQKTYSKEEVQEHFNAMLKVVPMTKVRNES